MKSKKLGTLGTKAQLAIALAAIGAADGAIAGTRYVYGGGSSSSCPGAQMCSGTLPGGSQTWYWCCSLGPIERCGSASWMIVGGNLVAAGSCISN
jgi:hypothetical protein